MFKKKRKKNKKKTKQLFMLLGTVLHRIWRVLNALCVLLGLQVHFLVVPLLPTHYPCRPLSGSVFCVPLLCSQVFFL